MSTPAAGQRPTEVRTYSEFGVGRSSTGTGNRAQAVFGHATRLVPLTLGWLALSAYLGRSLAGGIGIAFLLGQLERLASALLKPETLDAGDAYAAAVIAINAGELEPEVGAA